MTPPPAPRQTAVTTSEERAETRSRLALLTGGDLTLASRTMIGRLLDDADERERVAGEVAALRARVAVVEGERDRAIDALNAKPVAIGICEDCETPVTRSLQGLNGSGTESCGCCHEGGEALDYTIADYVADLRDEHANRTKRLPNGER